MKTTVALASLLLTVTTVRADVFSFLGDLEHLGNIGEIARTVDQTRGVLGHSTSQSYNAAIINRGIGQAKHSTYRINTMNDLPYVVRDIKEIGRYVNGIKY